MRYLAAVLMVVASGCAATPVADRSAAPEVLHAIVLMPGQIEVKVTSHGCTEAQHFSVRRTEGVLTVVRRVPDRCRRAPFVKTLLLDVAALGRAPVVVTNPFALPAGKASKRR